MFFDKSINGFTYKLNNIKIESSRKSQVTTYLKKRRKNMKLGSTSLKVEDTSFLVEAELNVGE